MGETPLAGTVHPNKWDPFCGRRGHEKAAKGMEHLYWIGKKSLFLIFEGPLTISPFYWWMRTLLDFKLDARGARAKFFSSLVPN